VVVSCRNGGDVRMPYRDGDGRRSPARGGGAARCCRSVKYDDRSWCSASSPQRPDGDALCGRRSSAADCALACALACAVACAVARGVSRGVSRGVPRGAVRKFSRGVVARGEGCHAGSGPVARREYATVCTALLMSPSIRASRSPPNGDPGASGIPPPPCRCPRRRRRRLSLLSPDRVDEASETDDDENDDDDDNDDANDGDMTAAGDIVRSNTSPSRRLTSSARTTASARASLTARDMIEPPASGRIVAVGGAARSGIFFSS
jgi:hypothetical protein